ncbi:protein HEAT-STRESS-ASSOCIATED 32 [Colletotrichum liriopes]|uniref:Protein HEAT-STRESS-ASSOCIATED 32 n=1 Tax=Colletotrichum liriopes TaxID=708192 RepID=A0AA37GB46_9PEZI|nr:protein HEAT-STRESS-ASSOCIATED 32 [Colletotrichum liriopes]
MGRQSTPSRVSDFGKKFVTAGVKRVMVESEDIAKNVKTWRADVIQKILRDLSMEKVMFEVAHSQIVQLSGPRAGIVGMADTFANITTFR